jgi:hypothetical protein
MADSRKRNERPLRREHHASRLEEELWALAYQQIQPVIRRVPAPTSVCQSASPPEAVALPRPVAQGA